MTTVESTTRMLELPHQDAPFEEAQLAAAAFLARYSGRTLDAYRHDLRMFFQWASDSGLEVLTLGSPYATCRSRPVMPIRGPPSMTAAGRTSTDTPPTSSSPSSQAADELPSDIERHIWDGPRSPGFGDIASGGWPPAVGFSFGLRRCPLMGAVVRIVIRRGLWEGWSGLGTLTHGDFPVRARYRDGGCAQLGHSTTVSDRSGPHVPMATRQRATRRQRRRAGRRGLPYLHKPTTGQ